MLTTAALALLCYALYVVGWSLLDLMWWSQLEVWANLVTIVAAGLLTPAVVLVRARIPGGMPLAFAGLVGVQAISLHNSMHIYGEIWVLGESMRGAFGLILIAMAWIGQKEEAAREAASPNA